MIRRFLCWLAVILAIPPLRVDAWQASRLNIAVEEGEAAINNVRQRTARRLTVRVTDAGQAPAAKAMVVFSVPESGASGTFGGGRTTETVATDAEGRASVRFQPNAVEGRVEIRVNVSQNGETARATITQFNMVVPAAQTEKKGGSGKLVAILALVGAAAAGGVVAATRSGGTSAPAPAPQTPTLSITPGAGTVGPPQ